jgi:hypothetical protein
MDTVQEIYIKSIVKLNNVPGIYLSKLNFAPNLIEFEKILYSDRLGDTDMPNIIAYINSTCTIVWKIDVLTVDELVKQWENLYIVNFVDNVVQQNLNI